MTEKPIPITKRDFHAVGPRTLERMTKDAEALLRRNAVAMDMAYFNADELSVSITFKLKPGRSAGALFIDSKISFVKDRCKDSFQNIVNERQGQLPGME